MPEAAEGGGGAPAGETAAAARRDGPAVLDIAGRLWVTRLSAPFQLHTGRDRVHMKALVGAPFGSEYSLQGTGHLTPVSAGEATAAELAKDWSELEADGRSNAELAYRQEGPDVVTHDTVNSLKRKGTSGDDIVQSIVQSSATFESKTAFSQAKYLKKKAKKHNPRVVLRRATACAVAEANHAAAVASNANGAIVPCAALSRAMRYDVLALLLHHGAATPGADVLVLDGSRGLLAAAVAERLAGHGRAVVLPDDLRYNVGTRAPWAALRQVDLDDAALGAVAFTTPGDLARALGAADVPHAADEEAMFADKRDAPPPRATHDSLSEVLHDRGGFGSLIGSSGRMSPCSSLRELLPLLAPGAPFVLHSPYVAALAEACSWLRESQRGANVQVFDSFLREHQVLPNRSHPQMNATPSAGAGFLLVGHKADV